MGGCHQLNMGVILGVVSLSGYARKFLEQPRLICYSPTLWFKIRTVNQPLAVLAIRQTPSLNYLRKKRKENLRPKTKNPGFMIILVFCVSFINFFYIIQFLERPTDLSNFYLKIGRNTLCLPRQMQSNLFRLIDLILFLL